MQAVGGLREVLDGGEVGGHSGGVWEGLVLLSLLVLVVVVVDG